MTFIKSIIAALSMYTVIPMPGIEWSKDSRKYILAVFPICGLPIGGLFLLLFAMRTRLYVHIPWNVFYMVGAVIPAIVTGGIHLDGLMDVSDALGSNAPREKKLEIMRDPRTGAFGAIGLAIYFIAYMAGLSLVRSRRQVLFLCLGFIISRALSGLALLTLPNAREDGLAKSITGAEGKKLSIIIAHIWIGACVVGAYYLYGFIGALILSASLCFFFFYEIMAMRVFGGLTGDLAGWFLCIYEMIFAWLTGILGYFWFL